MHRCTSCNYHEENDSFLERVTPRVGQTYRVSHRELMVCTLTVAIIEMNSCQVGRHVGAAPSELHWLSRQLVLIPKMLEKKLILWTPSKKCPPMMINRLTLYIKYMLWRRSHLLKVEKENLVCTEFKTSHIWFQLNVLVHKPALLSSVVLWSSEVTCCPLCFCFIIVTVFN